MGGGYFQFFTKNRPQKHAILHTSQANGGARAPPPPLPPGYATVGMYGKGIFRNAP